MMDRRKTVACAVTPESTMRSINRFTLIATIEWAQVWAQAMLCA